MYPPQDDAHGRDEGVGKAALIRGPLTLESIDDAEALTALHKDLYPSLMDHAMSLLRSRERADDAVQSAFLSTIAALRRGKRIEDAERWLHRCVRNASLTELRRKQTVSDEALESVSADLDPADLAQSRERFSHLNRAIGELPPHVRTALLLSEIRGFSYGEVAAEMQRSVESVRSLIFRARRQLRATMDSKLGILGTPLSLIVERLRPLLESVKAVVAPYLPAAATAAVALVVAAAPATQSQLPVLQSQAAPTRTVGVDRAETGTDLGTSPREAQDDPAQPVAPVQLTDDDRSSANERPREPSADTPSRGNPGMPTGTPASAPALVEDPVDFTQLPPEEPIAAPRPPDDDPNPDPPVEYPAPGSGGGDEPDQGTDAELGYAPDDGDNNPQVSSQVSQAGDAAASPVAAGAVVAAHH